MKLDAIETWSERIELTRPYTIASGSFTNADLGFLQLRAGVHTGLGCASPLGVADEERRDCDEPLRALAALDPADTQARTRWRQEHAGFPAARAALDMALHDLEAKQRGVPLVEMLGAHHGAMRTSVTIGIKDEPGDVVAEAEEYVGRGFRCLKVKVGDELDSDLERLARLRERFGTAVDLRIDANCGYAWREMERLFAAVAKFGIELVEQPLGRHDDDVYPRLAQAQRRLIALDESVIDLDDAQRHAALAGRCGTFNVKLMKCGGIAPALEIARVAHAADIGLLWGCSDESVISIAAALHAACACPATRYLDLDGHLDLARDPARGGFVLEDGIMRLTGAPGLGVELADDRGVRRGARA